MKVAIHQPEHLPWLGFFNKLASSDLFVLLDDVQYQSFTNRNKMKTPDGWQWFTVPLEHPFHRSPINTIKIHNKIDWREETLTAIMRHYKKAPYCDKYIDFFKETYGQDWTMLVDLNIHFIENIMKMLSIKTKIIKSSSLKTEGKKTELMLSICKQVGADTYLSGQGAKDYMKDELFLKENIKVEYQEFHHPTYNQIWGEFLPGMSIIDFLFNCGEDKFNQIVMKKNK